MGIDVYLGREAKVEDWVVAITLNLNPDPAQWSFQMYLEDSKRGRLWAQNQCGGPHVLVLNAPINKERLEQVYQWVEQFSEPHLPVLRYVSLTTATISKIRELKREERKAREAHEWVKKVMAKHAKGGSH